jgi:isopentenyldiphosphate isomerase
MTPPEEYFEIVDAEGHAIGRATRRECHGNPALRHRVVHVIVLDPQGRWYLQKRSAAKDIQPGKWDTSVGGHLCPGETPDAAARREMAEELGLVGPAPEFLYRYTMSNTVETELVDTYLVTWSGALRPDPKEIEEGRWWTPDEIRADLGTGRFTDNFETEFRRHQAGPGAR